MKFRSAILIFFFCILVSMAVNALVDSSALELPDGVVEGVITGVALVLALTVVDGTRRNAR